MAKAGNILVLNSGSSSLKFGVFAAGGEDEVLVLEGSAEGIGRPDGRLHINAADGGSLFAEDHVFETQAEALARIPDALARAKAPQPVAVGHRIVHGGPNLREHTLLTPEILEQLKAAEQFAPLHIPQALALIARAEKLFKGLPQFGCFDTAFHHTMPDVASVLPIPDRYRGQGVIRYGFHGLSYESVVFRLGPKLPSRAVFAHLGSGASLVAVHEGRSIDTTMGLTPTGGIPMSTRSGDLDPGVLLYLLRSERLDAAGLETLLDRHSGLAGYSGGESDMQALLKRAAGGDDAAELAVNAFCTAAAKTVGAYAALLGGLDLMVFTGGIGEHSAEVRSRVCAKLGFLGIDPQAGDTGHVAILATGEDAQIARHCRRLLA